MNTTFRISSLIIMLAALTFAASADNLTQSGLLTDAEWDKLQEHVALLDSVAFFPGLLPVIMKNRDALELTDEQKTAFRIWRKQNYQRMVDSMNEIIDRRIAFSRSALNPAVADAELIHEQKVILRLQEELLSLRLSCRKLIMVTFSPSQWDNFAFILEDYPQFAGLLHQ
jgi:hypothetical protein